MHKQTSHIPLAAAFPLALSQKFRVLLDPKWQSQVTGTIPWNYGSCETGKGKNSLEGSVQVREHDWVLPRVTRLEESAATLGELELHELLAHQKGLWERKLMGIHLSALWLFNLKHAQVKVTLFFFFSTKASEEDSTSLNVLSTRLWGKIEPQLKLCPMSFSLKEIQPEKTGRCFRYALHNCGKTHIIHILPFHQRKLAMLCHTAL